MVFSSVFMIKFLQLYLLLFIHKVFSILVNVISVLDEVPGVFDHQILTFVYLDVTIPLGDSPFLLLLNLVKFPISHELSLILLLHLLLFFHLPFLLHFKEYLLVLDLFQGRPGGCLSEGDDRLGSLDGDIAIEGFKVN